MPQPRYSIQTVKPDTRSYVPIAILLVSLWPSVTSLTHFVYVIMTMVMVMMLARGLQVSTSGSSA